MNAAKQQAWSEKSKNRKRRKWWLGIKINAFLPSIKFSNSQSDLHELGLNEFIPICIFFGKERAISLSGRFELRLRRTEIKQSCIIDKKR